MSRRAQTLTSEQKTMVASVRRVAKQRARVNDTYIRAIVQARESGVTYSAIAKAAGTSSQAAQEIVRRHMRAQVKDSDTVADTVEELRLGQRGEQEAASASGGQIAGAPTGDPFAAPATGVAALWAPVGQESPGE